MALHDRVKVATATVGAGNLALGAAVAPFTTFALGGVVDGETVPYLIEDGNAWELGWGQYAAAGPTLTRNLLSSSTGALLALTGAAKVEITVLSRQMQFTEIANYTVPMGGLIACDFTAIPPIFTDLQVEFDPISFGAPTTLNYAVGNGFAPFTAWANLAPSLSFNTGVVYGVFCQFSCINLPIGQAFLQGMQLTTDPTSNGTSGSTASFLRRAGNGMGALRLTTTGGNVTAGNKIRLLAR